MEYMNKTIKMAEQFLEHCKRNPDQYFAEALRDFLGYQICISDKSITPTTMTTLLTPNKN